MNLTELVHKLPEERLKSYISDPIWQEARERGLTWSEAAADPQSVKAAAAAMPPFGTAVLRTMLAEAGAAPVDEDRLLGDVRRLTALSGAECRIGLQQLLQAGVIIAVRKVWGELLYFMPAECFAMWQQAIFPCPLAPLPATVRQQIAESGAIQPPFRPLGRQLLTALASLARSGIQLTAKGTLSKKATLQLEESAEFDERWLRSFGLNWIRQEHYSLKAAFLLEAGQALGILRMEEQLMIWDEPCLAEWLDLDEEKRERDLLGWVLGLLLPAAGKAAHCASAICGLEHGEWYSASELDDWIAGVTGPGHNVNETDNGPDWYTLLHSLGWLELAELRGSGTPARLFRRKSFGGADWRELVIQPSGEVMTGAGAAFALRWELELVGERVLEEELAVYRLTSRSIAEAVEHGRTLSSIRRFLTDAGGGRELPQSVESMLEEWTRSACRSEFAEVVLLRFDHREMADRARNNPTIAPLLLEELGSKDFIVEKSQVSELRRLLQKAGFPPRKGLKSSAESIPAKYPLAFPADAREPDSRSDKRKLPASTHSFVYEPYPLRHFELPEPKRMEAADQLLPELERVPAMWTKQLRSYHSSTRKELIEQALQWQIPVQLKIERELRSFVPERMEQRGGDWAVIGLLREADERRTIRLTPDMWEEMKLVIPDGTVP